MGNSRVTDLFQYAQEHHAKEFGGATYDEKRDGDRLKAQLSRVRSHMLRNSWQTLDQISEATGDPPASVSARLRDLRKQQFGAYTIEREYGSRGLWRYRIKI
jgi:hypothetical protein